MCAAVVVVLDLMKLRTFGLVVVVAVATVVFFLRFVTMTCAPLTFLLLLLRMMWKVSL